MSSAMDEPVVYDADKHSKYLSDLLPMHKECSSAHNTAMRFLPPFDDEKMLNFWKAKAQAPRLTLILQLAPSPTGLDKIEVAGVVALVRHDAETGPFRAEVELLMVSPKFQKRGIARRLMNKLETIARAEGRTMLVKLKSSQPSIGLRLPFRDVQHLGTQKDSPAELVYAKLGFIKYGEIPRWAIKPMDGVRVACCNYYKDLEIEG